MTTIDEEVPDITSGTDREPTAPQPRVRRFAPRRSRSSGITTAPESTAPTIEPPVSVDAVTVTAPPKQHSPDTTTADAANTVPGKDSKEAESGSKTTRGQRTRSRKSVPTVKTAEVQMPETEPVSVEQVAVPSDGVAAKPARSRRRGTRVTEHTSEVGNEPRATIPALPGPTVENEPILTQTAAAPRARRERKRPARSTAKQTVETPATEGVAAAVEPPFMATPDENALSFNMPEGTVVAIDAIPDEAVQSERMNPVSSAADELPTPQNDPFAGWLLDEPRIETAPGGELDGTEALARALIDMFPLEGTTPPILEDLTLDEESLEQATFEAENDLLAEAEATLRDDEIEEQGSSDGDEANKRRGRRGRRGGRGRRRNGAPATDEPDLQIIRSMPDLGIPAVLPLGVLPPRNGEAAEAFTPETPSRPHRPWNEQRSRRPWGKPIVRETQQVNMPPPKPSNSGRFAPIPQAAPPPAALSAPAELVARATPLELPDLRIDEPLAPNETRFERLMDVQTRLMYAMLQQQARQLEVLTASVNSLHQVVQNIGTTAQTQLPRTAIFVDAPNVCYAADNARIALDFGRMLKYLSRDRQLVHALSYSPIIDDVREGIRYETQRFVAPFLRAGYKMVTKPLKRFSDGSAKGNFDIELALDIITMAERLDVVVLVSGDSDFESVIEHIQSKGVRVEVVAFASNVSTELVNVADVFIDISQHLEHMKAL